MRNYGRLETAIWQSPKLTGAGTDAKLLWAYLIACPHGNALGCFVLPRGYIAIDLELDATVVANAVQTLIDRGLIEYDSAASLVRIVGWWGHNGIENKNVAIGIAKVLKKLPKSDLVARVVADLVALENAHFNEHVKPGLTVVQPSSPQVTKPGSTATEPPDTGNLNPELTPLPPKRHAEEKKLETKAEEPDLEIPECLRRAPPIQTRIVAGGFKQIGAGKRIKNPRNADAAMEAYLASHCAMSPTVARDTVSAARTPGAEGHVEAYRFCEKISRDNKLGWFHMEAAE